jgi:hypothetical protein
LPISIRLVIERRGCWWHLLLEESELAQAEFPAFSEAGDRKWDVLFVRTQVFLMTALGCDMPL